jgi:hypothetical protein
MTAPDKEREMSERRGNYSSKPPGIQVPPTAQFSATRPPEMSERVVCSECGERDGEWFPLRAAQLAIRQRESLMAERDRLQAEVARKDAALRDALTLPTLAVMAEEQSSAHFHGPRRAAEYERKMRAVLDAINEALAGREPTHD